MATFKKDCDSPCQVCHKPTWQCMCVVSLRPEDEKVTPIRPEVKVADPAHIDLRFDVGNPLDNVLAKASAANLKGGIIIGYKPDGSVYVDCNINDGPLALWAIKYAEGLLIKGALPS